MKKGVEDDRGERREKAKKEADKLLAAGKEHLAMRMFTQSIDITPQMAHTFILALREMKIEHYVAPFEADAQLAYFYLTKEVDLVITEDSDLLAFGVEKAMFKMDAGGYGQLVDMTKLHKIKEFKDFDKDMFLIACIFSGCDYLDSLKGVGLQKAIKLVSNAGNENTFLESMTILRAEAKIDIPKKYEKHFMRAFLTFKFQRIFCPKRKILVSINDPSEN